MIHLEHLGPIAVLRLDHGKVSALDTELMGVLHDRLDEVESSHSPAVILTGTGSNFSAGVDLWRVLEGGEDYLGEFLPALTKSVSRLFTFPKPVVAAVNGHAIAGGCILVCCCDYRIMADVAGRIGVPELRVQVPFPSLALEILRFAASSSRLQELVYLGETYSPKRARDRGLIDEIVSPTKLIDRAYQVAERLAAIPAPTFQVTKRQMRQHVLDRVELLDEEIEDEVARSWTNPQTHEAIREYMDDAVGKSEEKETD